MTTRLIWIGDFHVDPEGDVIRHDGNETRVTPRNMDVLTYLVAHQGDVVRAQDLLNELWPGGRTSYNAVYKSIAELRHIFGDTPHTPRYIQTVAKRGYRLIAEVREDAKRASEPEMREGRTMTIAVVQFTNIDGNTKNEAMVQGLAEALIGRLIEVSGVQVASFPVGVRELPSAEWLLEGSLQRDGDRLRITARLTRSDDRIHLLSRQFDMAVGEIFSLQDEVADQIVEAVSDALEL